MSDNYRIVNIRTNIIAAKYTVFLIVLIFFHVLLLTNGQSLLYDPNIGRIKTYIFLIWGQFHQTFFTKQKVAGA